MGGAALAGAVARIDPRSRGEGIPSCIHGIKEGGGLLSPRVTAVKAASALATLAAWGSGGSVGPLGRVAAGLVSSSAALAAPESGGRSLRRTAAVCGLSATVAGVTGGAPDHTPGGFRLPGVRTVLRRCLEDVSARERQGRFGPAVPLAVAVLIMILVRSAAVVPTVGSGQSAGFFAPPAQMGMLLGTFTAVLFGMHGNPGGLHILQATGFAGLVAGSLNVPIAAAIIVTEVFGAPFGLAAVLASVMAFQINSRHAVCDFETDSRLPRLPDGSEQLNRQSVGAVRG